jgi:hypothetical protein
MANIVITSTSTLIKVNLGGYNSSFGMEKEYWHKHSLHCKLVYGDAFVKVSEDNGTDIALTFDAQPNCYIVDSVDGVAPTSNAHLYSLLEALL